VIGILNCWRQFGRRYFWPHLFLGMVAASLGVSSSLSQSEFAALSNTSSSLNHLNYAYGQLNNVAWLQAYRRTSPSIDYWQQHALRTVIRHLSFALSPTVAHAVDANYTRQVSALQIQHLALLASLNALLTHQPQPVIESQVEDCLPVICKTYQPGIWLSGVQGIRAGPAASL
jgi:secretion monitor